ncbi:hypothetical protein [Chondrinema litorale]|uniref:hypothetical protein n=1 Tax=Chondrinema litorale TaxID=2994555 RepID=UPI0025438969|nr:hypothetical protein [Chondrinema litorale]UZR96137.1 hypothetical protein OQ292_09995 [Chondrinema litorale]
MKPILFFLFILLSFNSYGQKLEMTNKVGTFYEEGEQAFWRHMKRYIKYPVKAQEKGIVGISEVNFRINCDNKLESFEILKELGYGIEDELKRLLIDTEGNWLSCENRNENDVYNLSIAFSLKDEYKPREGDCDMVVNAMCDCKFIEDSVLEKKLDKALSQEKYAKAQEFLTQLINRYPNDEKYQEISNKINSKTKVD